MSQINNLFINDVEDFDIAMPMYNLQEYRDNYSITLEILWSFYRDKANAAGNEKDDDGNYRVNRSKKAGSTFFVYQTKIGENTSDTEIRSKVFK